MKKVYRVIQYFNYAEIYDVEAESEDAAKELVLSGEYDEPDDIYKETDLYEVRELKE